VHDPENAAPTASGFGDRLRQAREAQKISIHEVATRLHLKPAVILALEEHRYHDLPGAAFARGYLRAYARLMRLDVEGSLQSEQLKDDGAMIHPLAGLSSPKIGGSGWMFKIAGYLIVAALGCGWCPGGRGGGTTRWIKSFPWKA
jgi:cytoskeleton protein RodZ